MSEVMTSESIIEAEWLLKGYWSKMRFAFKTPKGAWSDVDVLAYNPEEKHLVISESKVRGPKNIVCGYTKHSYEKYGSIIEYDKVDNGSANYFSFLRHLPRLCNNGVIFEDFMKMVNRVTIQLVSNYVVSSNLKDNVLSTIENEIKEFRLPVKANFLLDTTLDVIARIIVEQRTSGQGKRYGHPVLDIAREINRYFYPSVRYAGGKDSAGIVKEEATKRFLEAIGIKKA